MKKPETFEELFKLINPDDLYQVLCFSGINDHRNKEHSNLRRKLCDNVFNSYHNQHTFGDKEYYRIKHINIYRNMKDIDYELILESLQDFYYWSHEFNHTHAHIFQRVQNALEIPMEDISIIMSKIKEEKGK